MAYKIPQKKAPLKEKPYKNKKYLQWLHQQDLCCMVCAKPQIEIHHINQGAKGRADNRTVPLCPECHRGKYSPHGADKSAFEGKYMTVMENHAVELFTAFNEEHGND